MAEPLTWRIAGRALLLPDDWRARLVARLGARPRRLGVHAELALFGALEALADAGETTLPADALVRVCSMKGPVGAIGAVLDEAQSDLPLPFGFLQSQPSQMLAALAAALGWQGDAAFVVMRDPLALTALAAAQAGSRGLLLGWVEEAPATSCWLRLVPSAAPPTPFEPATDFARLLNPETGWLQLRGREVAVARETD